MRKWRRLRTPFSMRKEARRREPNISKEGILAPDVELEPQNIIFLDWIFVTEPSTHVAAFFACAGVAGTPPGHGGRKGWVGGSVGGNLAKVRASRLGLPLGWTAPFHCHSAWSNGLARGQVEVARCNLPMTLSKSLDAKTAPLGMRCRISITLLRFSLPIWTMGPAGWITNPSQVLMGSSSGECPGRAR